MKDNRYTVVQHSAFAQNGDPQFERGLESAAVGTKGVAAQVEKAGGLLFDNYGQAEDFAEKAMYPEGAQGIIPQARGAFANVKVGGRAVYIPVREVTVTG